MFRPARSQKPSSSQISADRSARPANAATAAFREPAAQTGRGPGTDLGLALAELSGGRVTRVTDSGPVLASGSRRRHLRTGTLALALITRDRAVLACLTAGWLICVIWFWSWWLEPVHRISLAGTLINSLVLGAISCFPLLFVVVVNRLRRVNSSVQVPDLRVAFVVTRAPAEPWDVASATLSAMLSQRFPHGYDVWLCDERPTPAILRWCARHGVKVSTRQGVQRYHRSAWPRRTRCKEGNLAYFYDHWGYRHYDVVAQLDCDHLPTPTYLAEMLRPFADPAVGYVAAPSVCDANAANSWSARGRLYREATFHGPFQLGHTGGLGPLCIGSHYAVRTAALRQIGGIGPELAEDFSTTFLLNVAGWQGVFAIDAEAHGDGPETFTAMAVQEFQWSRSLTAILIGLMPRNLRRLPVQMRARFLYALGYYILLASATATGLALAMTAAVSGVPWINVNYLAFVAHFWPIAAWLLLMILLLRRRGLLRPPRAPVISWESWLFALTRWPYVACGIAAALWQVLRSRPITFAVTPKGDAGARPLPARTVLPYLLISVASAGAALIGERHVTTAGYVFLCLLAALMYAVVVAAVPLLHARETAARTGQRLATSMWQTARGALTLAALDLALTATAIASFPHYVAPLLSR